MYCPDGTTKRPFSAATATHIGLNSRPMYGGKLRHQKSVFYGPKGTPPSGGNREKIVQRPRALGGLCRVSVRSRTAASHLWGPCVRLPEPAVGMKLHCAVSPRTGGASHHPAVPKTPCCPAGCSARLFSESEDLRGMAKRSSLGRRPLLAQG